MILRIFLSFGDLSLDDSSEINSLKESVYSDTHKVRASGVKNLSELMYTYKFWDRD